jgi:hypothetical protein
MRLLGRRWPVRGRGRTTGRRAKGRALALPTVGELSLKRVLPRNDEGLLVINPDHYCGLVYFLDFKAANLPVDW